MGKPQEYAKADKNQQISNRAGALLGYAITDTPDGADFRIHNNGKKIFIAEGLQYPYGWVFRETLEAQITTARALLNHPGNNLLKLGFVLGEGVHYVSKFINHERDTRMNA